MKKSTLTFVAAVLAVLSAVLAPKVSADEFSQAMQNVFDTVNAPVRQMGQNLCDSHRGTGDAVEASWCYGVVTDSYGRAVGGNPNSVRGQRARGFRADDLRRARRHQQYGSYGYPYGYDDYGYAYGNGVDLNGRNVGAVLGGVAGGIATRNNRSGWVKAGGILGGAAVGAVIGNKVANRNDRRYDRGEDPSDCVKQTLKEFAKRHVAVSAEQVIGMCGGSNNAPEPPPAPQTESAPAPRQQVERRSERTPSVYVTAGNLCNDTNTPISVYVNGNPVGRLSPGQVVALSTLPQGKVQYFPIN